MSNLPEWLSEIHSPLDAKLGFEFLELTAERVVGRIPVEGNQQPFGLLHGGASGVLVESLASMGGVVHARTLGKQCVGVDLHVTHLASVREGHVTGTATAVRLGASMGHYQVELRDDRDRVTAVGSLTVHFIDPR